MLGLSYGEIFLILGATAALIGPKDLPVIGRTAGRLAGRAIGYVQLARGQFDSVMQQSQARQVHKELQDTMAQLEAIRHEIRSISIMNPGPSTRRLVDDLVHKSDVDDVVNSGTKNGQSGNVLDATSCKVSAVEQTDLKKVSTATVSEVSASKASDSSILHTQAIAYARVAESSALKRVELQTDAENEVDLQNVLPVSAESAGLLPKRPENMEGSDILLEAIVEAEMAHNAQDFFARPENQIKCE